MKYIKTFENSNFAESLKIGDLIIKNDINSIFVSEVESTTPYYHQLFMTTRFIYTKALKKWREVSSSSSVYTYKYINNGGFLGDATYSLLTKKELNEIELSLDANKYNI